MTTYTSLLSTSSNQPLELLLSQVAEQIPDAYFDLFLLRDVDITDCFRDRYDRDTTLAAILSDKEFVDAVVLWLQGLLQKPQFAMHLDRQWFSAIATYLPSITLCGTGHSRQGAGIREMRSQSIQGLVNAVRLACRLYDLKVMKVPIVEIVCGTILDFCDCKQCKDFAGSIKQRDRIPGTECFDCFLIGDRGKKLDLLFDSLNKVCSAVNKDLDCKGRPWAIALELEPGPTYLLNDDDALGDVSSRLRNEATPLVVRNHVGLNVDFAHYRVANITANRVNDIKPLIVHAHICDNPGMHTRDLPVGDWMSLDDTSSIEYEMMRSVIEEYETPSSGRNKQLPSSGCIALELEGCGRPDWVYKGMALLKYMLWQCRRDSPPLKSSSPTVP